MEVQIFTKEMSDSEVKKVKEYSASKIPPIESLLKHFAPDAVKLHINAEKLGRRSAYRVEFVLYLPSKTIMGREASHEITKAVDLAKDRIIRQLKKHQELLRSRGGAKRKINIKEIDYSKLPVLEILKSEHKDVFIDILSPHLEKLNKFIKREILYKELTDEIPENEIESETILNDVILEFYENYNPQLKTKDLEQWLYTVAINKIRVAIDELKDEGLKMIPIEEVEAPKIKKTASDDIDEVEKYFEEKEIASFVDNVARDDEEMPHKIASKKEMFRFLMDELGKIQDKKREAFILNKIEGFVAAQISEMQHRPLKEVKNDIEEVQKLLLGKAKEEFGEETM